MAEFFIPIFILLTIILVVTLIITYAKTVKMYPLMYILSVFSYATTVTYVMDAYDMGKNSIILLLVISSAVMIGFGKLLSTPPKKNDNYKKNIIIPIAIIIVLCIVGMFEFGLTVEYNPITVSNDDLYVECNKGYSQKYVDVLNISAKNNFIIPRKIQTNYYICEESGSRYFNLVTYEKNEIMDYNSNVEVLPFMSKEITLKVSTMCKIAPEKIEQENINITKLYLFERDGRDYMDCYDLIENKADEAIIIKVN